ncbi:MAG: hypothetical protein U0163_19140 [Gemmatimonadaceae bacterium]
MNTIVGPVRLDIGYNPYARPAGPAYFTPDPNAFDSKSLIGLICVSPGNSLVVRKAMPQAGGKPLPPVQEAGECPGSYQPPRRATVLGRLTFNFSIGQAF